MLVNSLDQDIQYNVDKTTLIRYPAEKTDSVFTIPDSVTSIGDYAFKDCTSLAERVTQKVPPMIIVKGKIIFPL
jgi:hypothetical protein